MTAGLPALHGKSVLVIGGSSGIGFEIARQAQAIGAEVTVTGRDAQRLAAAAHDLGDVRNAQLDAHDHAALEQFFIEGGMQDHIVSMVGDSMVGGFLTTTPETMGHVLHSKFLTNWMIGRHAATGLRAGGSLTFTAGTGARAQDACASYVANLALGGLVEGLAFELAPHRRVNAVAPTFMGVGTGFWKDMTADAVKQQQAVFIQGVPLRRVGTVAEVAAAYVSLISNTFITGQVLAVDGGVMLDK
jgi:NAD(P)-dependent dehydrogenase (short-subunit alcohol dehydrogenase family)